jgi:hypothetical protein
MTLDMESGVPLFEVGELSFGRELSIDEQECHFKEGRILRELLNRNASVFEDALISIDVADLGSVADSVHISRVIHSQRFTLSIEQLTYTLGINEERVLAFFDAELDCLAGAVVDNGQLTFVLFFDGF